MDHKKNLNQTRKVLKHKAEIECRKNRFYHSLESDKQKGLLQELKQLIEKNKQ